MIVKFVDDTDVAGVTLLCHATHFVTLQTLQIKKNILKLYRFYKKIIIIRTHLQHGYSDVNLTKVTFNRLDPSTL